MKTTLSILAALALVPAAYAAEQKQMEGMPMDHKNMKDMNMKDMPMEHKADAKIAKATGTVKKIDSGKGTVTIAHGPVAALGWPSMTMGFKAEPEQLKDLKEGDEVEFEFTSKGMDSTITSIDKN